MLEQDNVSRIKILLKAHPRGLTITDVSSNLKMNRNSAAKYLEILQISGLVESRSYGTARVFFLTHRLPISALVSITHDLVITLDEGYHILFVNESFCTFFTITKEDVAGSHILEIFKTGIGGTVLPGIFSDIIAGKEGVHEVRLPRDTGDIFFKIKSMKTVFDDGSRGITIIMEDVTRETKDKIELEAKEARYRGIVEDQTEFVIRFLPDGTLSFVNSAFSLFMKKKTEDLLGTSFSDVVYAQDRTVVERSLKSLNQKNPVDSFECRIGRFKNPVRWSSWTLRALYDDRKDPVEYQAVGHDITTQKKEEDRIEQQFNEMEFFSEKLQQFIELAPDADIYRIIGTGVSEILPVAAICVSSFNTATLTSTIQAVCTEQDRRVFQEKIGKDVIGVEIPFDDPGLVRDLQEGRIIARNINLNSLMCNRIPEETCAAIEDELNLGNYYSCGLTWRGELLGTVTFSIRKGEKLKNVSLGETFLRAASIALQRSRAEAALVERENLYRSVLENFQDVYYRADMDGNLLMASPSALGMFGYSSLDDLPNKNIGRDFYLDPKKRNDFIKAITPGGSIKNFEAVLKKQDGTPVYTEISSHFLYDRNGVPVGMEGILRDISDRKEAERKIRRYVEELEFHSQKLLDFIMMEPSDNIFERILSDFQSMVPGSTIMVNSFDTETGMVLVRGLAASEKRREVIFRLLGRDLVGSAFPIDSRGLAAFQTGRLQKGNISIYEIAFRSIPEQVCDQLESELELGERYTIGFVRRGEIMGNTTIFLDKGRSIQDPQRIEMYAREAAIALQKYIADEARRKSDEKYRLLTENATDIVWIFNLTTGKFTYFSPAVEKIRGYTAEEAVELPLEKTLTPESYVMAMAELKKTLELDKQGLVQHDRIRIFEFELYCKDGSIIFTETTMKFLRNADGVPVSLMGITRDITERIRAEEALRESQQLLSSIVESIDDAVIGKDTQGTIVSWNRSAERIYGFTAGEMIGRKISVIIPPDRLLEWDENNLKIQKGQSINNLETKRIRKDGKIIDVTVTISPLINGSGKVIGASTIARDITSHKAEERLRENEEQYRSLMENISVGFYRSTGDPTGRFIWGNSSLVHMLGYLSFEELSGVDIAGMFMEQDGRKRLLDDLKSEGFVKNREIQLRRADGKPISVLVTALARFDSGGGMSCINGIVQDITVQRKAEDRTRMAHRHIHDILSCIPDPLVSTDHKNNVVVWNDAMERLTGVQKSRVAGRNDYEEHFPFYNPACPGLVTLFDAADGVLDQYYPGAYREGSTIIAPVRDPGNREDSDTVFTIRASPLAGPDGKRVGAVQIIHSSAPDDRPRTKDLR